MISSYFLKIYRFYLDGFSRMTIGKTLWRIIFIKVFVLLVVLKWFFFPDFLQTNFSTDQQRADHVIHQLTGSVQNN